MELSYNPQYNVAYIRFGETTREVETIRVSDELLLDMAPDGSVYGIELLNANEQLRRGGTATLMVLNECTGETAELPLPLETGASG
jgi:uncharacterized protein YuzE